MNHCPLMWAITWLMTNLCWPVWIWMQYCSQSNQELLLHRMAREKRLELLFRLLECITWAVRLSVCLLPLIRGKVDEVTAYLAPGKIHSPQQLEAHPWHHSKMKCSLHHIKILGELPFFHCTAKFHVGNGNTLIKHTWRQVIFPLYKASIKRLHDWI